MECVDFLLLGFVFTLFLGAEGGLLADTFCLISFVRLACAIVLCFGQNTGPLGFGYKMKQMGFLM